MKLFTWANLLTLINLLSGATACLLYISGSLLINVFICMVICLVADFLDGLVARKTKTAGPLGIQLDSLADVVSFGLLPGVLLLVQLKSLIGVQQYILDYIPFTDFNLEKFPLIAISIAGLLVTLFTALRLAKFNIDPEQKHYFKGLNSPTNALAIFSFVWLNPQNIYLVIGVTLLSCYLVISSIPMFSLKLNGFNYKKDYYLIIMLVASIIGLVTFGLGSIVFLVLLYIILSLVFKNQFLN